MAAAKAKLDVRQEVISEIAHASDDVLVETLDFLRFLCARQRSERFQTALLSEPRLAVDWNRPEEDEAWKDL